MDSTQKMLRTIINGQSIMKSELLGEINKLRTETTKGLEDVNKKMDKGFNNVDKKLIGLTKRVDKIGLQVARLEDDAPTVEEFDKLERRVTKVEQKVVAI